MTNHGDDQGAKASLLFAIDTGLLAIVATNLSPEDFTKWYFVAPAALSLGAISVSLWFLYRCAFPHLKGGAESLIYFRSVAGRTEAVYIEKFQQQSEDAYLRDVLGQVWRNAEILKIKFDSLKIAFILTALSLLPWLVLLVLSTLLHPRVVIK